MDFWVVFLEMDDGNKTNLGGLQGFRVAELCRSVYFVTAGIKAPAETYCSSPMKRQILEGIMKRLELFQLTGSLLQKTQGSA